MELCLGTAQFGLDYGVQGAKKQSEAKIDEIMEWALLHGISQFDSAEAYGDAETVIGNYIRRNAETAGDIKIVSKLVAGAFAGLQKSQWPEAAVKKAESGLSSIGIDKFEAYLFHNASVIYDKDAVEALYEVKKRGLANKVGVSIYSPEEAMKALEYNEIEAIQIPYNVFDQRLDKVGFFEKAKERSVTVYARSILLQGLITMDVSSLSQKMLFAGKYVKKLHDICERRGITPLEAAVGYVSAKEGIDFAVFGVDSLEQLKEFVAIKNNRLPEEVLEEIKSSFLEVEERLVNPTLW